MERPREPVLLFTDIEGSTPLWERHGPAMDRAVALHDRLVAGAVAAAGGRIFKTLGDGICAEFASVDAASTAALTAHLALAAADWPDTGPLTVRMAICSGPVFERDADLFGPTLNRCSRLLAAAHGGQVLLDEAAAGALTQGPPPIDLGEHQLRGIAQAQRIFQLRSEGLRERFPPLRQVESFAHNLPAATSPLIGREREMHEVAALLAAHRLVTLTGTSGTGKTRLALAVGAAVLHRFADGVWFVDCSACSGPDLVAGAVAEVLALREQAEAPAREVVARWLASRRALLILDNCERDIEACATLAEAWLHAAPRLSILATSLRSLRTQGERRYAVAGLGLPAEAEFDMEALAASPAVRLFCERAAGDLSLDPANGPSIAALCRRLDGHPLAIELAAAATRLLEPAELCARLDDRFRVLRAGRRTAQPRQQSLQAAVSWGYDLLAPEAQALYRRLAPFRGGFGLAAAGAVGAPDLAEADLLEPLGELVDMSFVVAETTAQGRRFRLLETLRLYAAERAETAGEIAEACARHAAWYLDHAERQAARLRGPEAEAAVATLRAEHANLRAALGRLLAQGDGLKALRLATALWRFWYIRGHLREGREWLSRALAHRAAATPELVARALTGAGNLANALLECEQSVASHEEALAIRRALGDRAGEAASLTNLGFVTSRMEEFGRAAAYHRRSAEIAAEQGDRSRLTSALLNLSSVLLLDGRWSEAAAIEARAEPLVAAEGDHVKLAQLLHNAGHRLVHEGRCGEAAERLWRSLVLSRELGYPHLLAGALVVLAELFEALEQWAPAAMMTAAAAARRDTMESSWHRLDRAAHDDRRARLRAHLGEDAFAESWRRGAELTGEQLLPAVRAALSAGGLMPGSRGGGVPDGLSALSPGEGRAAGGLNLPGLLPEP